MGRNTWQQVLGSLTEPVHSHSPPGQSCSSLPSWEDSGVVPVRSYGSRQELVGKAASARAWRGAPTGPHPSPRLLGSSPAIPTDAQPGGKGTGGLSAPDSHLCSAPSDSLPRSQQPQNTDWRQTRLLSTPGPSVFLKGKQKCK